MTIFFIESREEEKRYDVFLWTYPQSQHLWVDTYITPAYCTGCKKQLDGTYAYLDSQQGQVGTLLCNHCGASIHCTDRHLFHHELLMSTGRTITLEYGKLYLLHPRIFFQIKKETGYDLFAKGRKVRLSHAIEEIGSLIHLPMHKVPQIQIVTDLHFPHLPFLVNQWLNLLRYMQLT